MQLNDRLTLDAPKRTRDGFLAVRAKAARAGVYDYASFEVGGEEHGFKTSDTVKIYRPEDEVFAADSVASFLAKPVTNNHPAEPVTAANWKDHARGVNMGALRDGEYLAFDLVIMDGALIADIDAGKRELSNGYACTLDWTAGTAPDGTAFDAIQRHIRGNHIAVVDKGRAGSECSIKDGNDVHDPRKSNGGKPFADCEANPAAIEDLSIGEKTNVTKITLDGLQVDLSDADAVKAAIAKIQGQVTDAETARDKALGDVATLTTDKAALEAKVVTLEKQVADAAITPEKLRDAAKAFSTVVSQAKALEVAVTDAMDEPAIKKAVVDAKLGDVAKDWTPEQIAISFATLAKDVKPEGDKIVALGDAQTANDANDASNKARAKMIADMKAGGVAAAAAA